ncbi:MAG: helix-turn-helix domain-containing protein [Sarcina sp.]|nr:helix-turn-helix domain-containing protein [Sarcina sp.]
MDMATRIKERRLAMDYTQEELASKLGLQKSAIAKYENGRVENIKRSVIQKMASILECSPSYLMGWDDASIPSYANIRPIAKKRYPVFGSVACGKPIYMAEEKEVYVDSTTDVKADFILIAKGDSMTGARINDGDLVFVRQQPEVENGDIAVVAIDDEATLKRFYKYSDDLIVLRAENPEYKDMEYRPGDHKDIRVLGKAVAFQSDLR